VDEIWKSVSANPDSLEVTQDEQEILNSRWTDFLQNPASALSVDDFKSQINTLRA
jgi:putative addiction module component (TIGR02574 family)